MKRRRFLKAMVAAPAAPALFAQQPLAPSNPVSATPTAAAASAVGELPKIESTVADAAADMQPNFFTAQQFSALQKLSDLLMPSLKGVPGALDTHVPEFLDFLIGSSPDRHHCIGSVSTP
jgi:ABC-type sugar transport system substrate-binding protein